MFLRKCMGGSVLLLTLHRQTEAWIWGVRLAGPTIRALIFYRICHWFHYNDRIHLICLFHFRYKSLVFLLSDSRTRCLIWHRSPRHFYNPLKEVPIEWMGPRFMQYKPEVAIGTWTPGLRGDQGDKTWYNIMGLGGGGVQGHEREVWNAFNIYPQGVR